MTHCLHTWTVYYRVRSVTQPACLPRSSCGHSHGLLWQSVINGYMAPGRVSFACQGDRASVIHVLWSTPCWYFSLTGTGDNYYTVMVSYKTGFRQSFCNCPKYVDIWILTLQFLVVQKFSSCLSPWKTKQGTKSTSIILPLNTSNGNNFVKLSCTLFIEYKHCGLHAAMCHVWNCLLLQFVFLSLWKT